MGHPNDATLRLCLMRAEEVQQLRERDLYYYCKDHTDPCWTGQTVCCVVGALEGKIQEVRSCWSHLDVCCLNVDHCFWGQQG